MALIGQANWGTTQENRVVLVVALTGWQPDEVHLDAAIEMQQSLAGALTLFAPAVIIPAQGWAVIGLPQWALDYTVRLRQELMSGQIHQEAAGWYARQALAELAREAPEGGAGYFVRRLESGALIFAPMPEIEALRAAICGQLWTEMQATEEPAELERLAKHLAPIAMGEFELVRCVAAYKLLGLQLPDTIKQLLAIENASRGTEFPDIEATAAYIERRFSARLRRQL